MQSLINSIKSAKSAVIIPHISADGDALASCQAMAYALSDMGVKSVIYAEETVPDRLDFLGEGIVVFNGEVPEFDTCIVLDCGDVGRVGGREVFLSSGKPVINIDHHRTNTSFGDYNLVKPDASATGEVLFDLFCEMGIKMTKDIAKYLYTAICSDTGGFAFSNVSSHTFKIAAELVGYDINHAEISRLLFDCVDIDSELLKAELTKSIRSYCGGKVRVVTVSREFAERFQLKPNDVDGLVDIPRRIRGTEIAVAIKELDDKIRISLRANGDADVSRVAMEFGGGGHIKAAGCSIIGETLEAAEKRVADACEKELSR